MHLYETIFERPILLSCRVMNISRGACLVLGAAVGVASVYLLRRLLFGASSDGSDKKDADNDKPKIVISDSGENDNRTRRRCVKRLKDTAIPKIVQNVQMEFSNLCDRDVWKIIIPVDKPQSPPDVFFDARTELSPNSIEQRNSLNCNDYNSTEYRSLPASLPHSENLDNIEPAAEFKESLKVPEIRKENDCKSMAQSTMLGPSSDKSPLKISIYDRTLRELMAIDKASMISQDRKDVEVVVHINVPKSPRKHFVKKITNLIKSRKRLNENV